MTKVKDLIKELSGTEYYLSIKENGRRLGGGFVFMPEVGLNSFLEYKVLDLEKCETSDIIKVSVTPPPLKKEKKLNGEDTGEESPRQDSGISKKPKRKRASNISWKTSSDGIRL